MRNTLEKCFSDSRLFVAMCFLAFLSRMGSALVGIVTADWVSVLADGVFLCLIVGIFLAFDKGETNVQKALFGAIYLYLFTEAARACIGYLTAGESAVICAVSGAQALVFLVLLAFHLAMQSDHIGGGKSLLGNQILLILLCLTTASEIFVLIVYANAWNEWFAGFALLFTVGLLVSAETKIQLYKRIRHEAIEAGKWDETARAEAKKLFNLDVNM